MNTNNYPIKPRGDLQPRDVGSVNLLIICIFFYPRSSRFEPHNNNLFRWNTQENYRKYIARYVNTYRTALMIVKFFKSRKLEFLFSLIAHEQFFTLMVTFLFFLNVVVCLTIVHNFAVKVTSKQVLKNAIYKPKAAIKFALRYWRCRLVYFSKVSEQGLKRRKL